MGTECWILPLETSVQHPQLLRMSRGFPATSGVLPLQRTQPRATLQTPLVDGRPRTWSNLKLPVGKMRQGLPKAQPALARAQPLFIYCPLWSRAKRPSTTACHQEHSQSLEQSRPDCPPGDSGDHIYIQGRRGEPDTPPLVLGRIS